MNVYPDDTLCEKRDHSKRFVSLPYERVRVRCFNIGESVAVQDHRDGCDINQIIARFSRTGVIPPGRGPGQYVDVSGMQTSDSASAILRSREVLEDARAKVAEARAAKLKAKNDKLAADLAELERLRAAPKPVPPAT